jgi:UDP-3-O-[3-hydroxymyristoyl] glucosamine N-acyltransferase
MPYSLEQLSLVTKTKLVGDPGYIIHGVDDLGHATPEDASFLANPLYRPLLETTNAGVVCVDLKTKLREDKNYLISDNPSETFEILIQLFLGHRSSLTGFSGVHPSAVIHPTAKIGQNVAIGPLTVIDANVIIEDNTHIGAHVVIGPSVTVGTSCVIHAHVTIREGCVVGHRVIIQPGVVIGSCGFGYSTDAKGIHTKQQQLGIVILEDDVEIGANTTIDRARFKATRIGRGTKVDNLVQIGHNTELGMHNIIVSQTGIAGSVKTGRNVVMGGQTGTVGHIEIAGGAMFAARSGIKKSIRNPGKYGGNPAVSLDEHNREQVILRRLLKVSG